MLQFKDH